MSETIQLTDKFLRSEFLKLNRRYFGGGLPKSTEVFWRRFLKAADGTRRWARTGSYRQLGRSGKQEKVFYIAISRCVGRVGISLVYTTLLHEMAHIATWNAKGVPHGPAFQREMLRLAKAGAFAKWW